MPVGGVNPWALPDRTERQGAMDPSTTDAPARDVRPLCERPRAPTVGVMSSGTEKARARRKRPAAVVLLLAVALALPLLLAACIEEPATGVNIENDLPTPVEIVYLKGGGMPGGRLEPARSRTFVFGLSDQQTCTTADIVARSAGGTVVARIPAPVCRDRAFSLSDYVVP